MKTDPQRLAAKHGTGLDLAGLGDLASMLDTPVVDTSKPRMFDLDRIHEDTNVRHDDNPGFAEEPMRELTESVKARGIKSPLSLRSYPGRPGHFIINHGHRRSRAARRAGLVQVPGFLDEDFKKSDQIIENIQRENLTAREIADFIGSELALGKTQAQIAQLLGKSKAFVSQHVKLLDLPEPVAEAFHSGRVRDVTVANELARAHEENPEAVAQILAAPAESLAAKPVTRDAVKALRKAPAKRVAKAPKGMAGAGAGDVRRMETALSDHLATPVQLVAGKGGKHLQLLVHAQNWDHFNDLLVRLGLGNLVDTDV